MFYFLFKQIKICATKSLINILNDLSALDFLIGFLIYHVSAIIYFKLVKLVSLIEHALEVFSSPVQVNIVFEVPCVILLQKGAIYAQFSAQSFSSCYHINMQNSLKFVCRSESYNLHENIT